MNNSTIKQIDEALKLHISYAGKSSNGKYLQIMDRLAYGYSGAPGIKISKLLDDYFKAVNVLNLDEAFNRLRNK